MTTNHFRMSYPAARGEMVLQGHADACAEFGHATWVINDVKQPRCPRCGETTATEEEVAEYVALLQRVAEEENEEHRVKELIRNTLELTSSVTGVLDRGAWYVSHKPTGRLVRWPGETVAASWSNNRSAVLAGFDYARELSTESGDDYELITGQEVVEGFGKTRGPWEHTSRNEGKAHAERRALIEQGAAVSLIAFDPSRGLYVFDVIA